MYAVHSKGTSTFLKFIFHLVSLNTIRKVDTGDFFLRPHEKKQKGTLNAIMVFWYFPDRYFPVAYKGEILINISNQSKLTFYLLYLKTIKEIQKPGIIWEVFNERLGGTD